MTRNVKAFTLAEMLTALTVMSIISLAVVTLTMALTTAQEYSEDFYRRIQIGRNALRRIERDVNKAKLITAGDDHSLVYWLEDSNENDDVELPELCLVRFDAATGQVHLYQPRFPPFWPQEWKDNWNEQMTIDMATDLPTAIDWLTSPQWLNRRVLATEVTDLTFTASPAPPITELLQTELTVGTEPRSVTLRSSAAMRANRISDLYMDEGTYYLDDE